MSPTRSSVAAPDGPSLGMTVIDVSKNNDWSRVRLESNPGAYGSVYPINGFIRPQPTT